MVSGEISIASYNCNGLADYKKRRSVFTWLKEKDYNIYCLQETHSTVLDEVLWKKNWVGKIYFSHGQRNSKGVMVLINNNFDPNVQLVQTDPQGRWIILNMLLDNKHIWLINLYGPNNDDPSFFDNIYKNVSTLQATLDSIIIVGDFNTVLNTSMDRKGNHTTNYHPQALKEIRNVMDILELVDIWRLKYPDLVRYTWRRLNQASRLDYFLISFSLAPKVKKCLIGDRMRSDHHIIGIYITLTEFPRGRGYWKFNQSLLDDKLFRTRTEEFITDFFRHNIGTADPHIVWDTFKCAFRGHAIQYSSIKQKQFRSKESILTKEIEGLTVQLDNNKNGTIEAQNKLEEKQKEMEELIQERSSVIYYKNKANWMEYGEKCTILFQSSI
jgi:exonuclease III